MSKKGAAQKQEVIAEKPVDKWLGKTLKFVLVDGRVVEGIIVRYDGHSNFILMEVIETRLYKDTNETVTRSMSSISVPKKLIVSAHKLTDEEQTRRDDAATAAQEEYQRQQQLQQQQQQQME